MSAETPYPQAYKFYLELGKLALDQQDYNEAYKNFRRAQMAAPTEQEPAIFINLIKRLQDNRIEPKPATKIFRPYKPSRANIIDEELDRYSRESPLKAMTTREKVIPPALSRPEEKRAVEKTAQPVTPQSAIPTTSAKYVLPPSESPVDQKQSIVYLDNNLWQAQPGTLIRVELRSSALLEARNFKRHLIITPGFIEVERIDRDRIKIIALKRGSTILHVWDDTGRWTFNVEVILPIRKSLIKVSEEDGVRSVNPFRISHSMDWSSYYRGQSYKQSERENLNYLQRILLEGETPYGDFDSHVIINQFDESTEVIGYGVGLTNGKIGDFKDFSIRGFDLQKTFSPLTMPGQYVRGVLLEAKAFDKNLEYSYVHGRDRATFGFLAPGILEERESFVEGARVTLFPEKENQYSVNYARGYGDARDSYLKDQVFSVEARHRFNEILLSGEAASDESATAITTGMNRKWDNHDLTVNFRDIESDFTSVTSAPGNQGEVGGSIFWNWRLDGTKINTHLDLYRERLLPNPEAEDTLNVDFNTTVDIPLPNKDRLRTSLYYVDTAGELSPRNDERANATYTKQFEFGERNVTAFVGATQQRSRFKLSSASEFDRYSLSTGFTIPLAKQLNYFTNYEYSWVYEQLSGERLTPNVLRAGLNYSKKIVDGWSIHSSFDYRNEEQTEGTNSFLAGEDSITGSIGTTYRPNEDFEIFADGRTRNVWAESADRTAFNDIDIRVGVRTSWELPLRWNPKGTIAGIVYKDLNRNQMLDAGEEGIADISIKVGKETAMTNEYGYYQVTVRAKSVDVGVEINSIPDGFIFSTPTIRKVEIIPHKMQIVDFGINAESGIYGIVYYDRNGNGKPDSDDEFAGKVKMTLDGKQVSTTDFEGNYFFGVVDPGKHQIQIDVNTLPAGYLPKIRIKNEIEVSEGSTYVFHIPLDQVKPKDK